MPRNRLVVLLPGRSFGPYAPQLFFPMIAALERGAEFAAVEWQDTDELTGMPPEDIPGWVSDQAHAALSQAQAGSAVVVGKSLGSYAAARVADLDLPAIWVTPVLTAPAVVEGLRRATAPFLLVGGTADPMWVSRTARSLTEHVLELPDADHGLFVSGSLSLSAHNIGLLAEASEAFLDEFVWS